MRRIKTDKIESYKNLGRCGLPRVLKRKNGHGKGGFIVPGILSYKEQITNKFYRKNHVSLKYLFTP